MDEAEAVGAGEAVENFGRVGDGGVDREGAVAFQFFFEGSPSMYGMTQKGTSWLAPASSSGTIWG